MADFEDAPDITKSGLYKTAYSAEYGQFGGKLYAAIIGNYDFGPGAQDVRLMQHLASVASVSHSPFIGAAASSFFGIEDYHDLPQLKDLHSVLDGPRYAKWKGFRESADSRYVGLVLPRFMLRLPYGADTQPVKGFAYQEDVSSPATISTCGKRGVRLRLAQVHRRRGDRRGSELWPAKWRNHDLRRDRIPSLNSPCANTSPAAAGLVVCKSINQMVFANVAAMSLCELCCNRRTLHCIGSNDK